MPPMETKTQLIEKLREGREKLEKMISKVTPEQMELPGTCGEWSARDMLAHLYDWQQRNIDWIAAVRRGEPVQVPAPGLTWKAADVDRLNHMIYEAHCHETLVEVLYQFRATFEHFMAQLDTFSEEELQQNGLMPFTGPNRNLVRWYKDYAFHDGWARNHIYNRFVKKKREKG